MQMTSSTLLRALYWTSMLLGALAVLDCWLIVYSTNKAKMQTEKEKYFSWDLGKMIRVFNEYERTHPSGKKAFWFKVLFGGAAVMFIVWFFLSVLISGQIS